MSYIDKVALVLVSVPVIAGWLLTELTEALGIGVRRDR